MDAASPWFHGFEARDFALEGMHIRARTGGRAGATPLLLLHGFPQTQAMWQRVVQRLKPYFQLVLPDQRGYGRSAMPPGDADHASYSKRTLALDHAPAPAPAPAPASTSNTTAPRARRASKSPATRWCCGASAAWWGAL